MIDKDGKSIQFDLLKENFKNPLLRQNPNTEYIHSFDRISKQYKLERLSLEYQALLSDMYNQKVCLLHAKNEHQREHGFDAEYYRMYEITSKLLCEFMECLELLGLIEVPF